MRPDLASFFHLVDTPLAPCCGLACFVARHDDADRWRAAGTRAPRVYCLGRCYASPAAPDDPVRPAVHVAARTPVVLRYVGPGGAVSLSDYRARGGYDALDRARALGPDAVLDLVDHAELRGRGGAGFPTARKWRAARAERRPSVVVVNADEGDPGAFVDRFLLEDAPHLVLESAAIAALAIGASEVHVYVRREYPDALARLQHALNEATAAGVLQGGGTPDLVVSVTQGHGSYVCGEETALLNVLEGRRPTPRVRPPYPASAGLHGRPTIVNNVETLAAIPWIVEFGADAYRAMGCPGSRGTKVLSLNSLFARPGLYEVEFGTHLRHIVEDLGGGLRAHTLAGVIVGGPLAGVVPPSLLDTPLAFDALQAIGASVGHGGLVAFDDRTSIRDLAAHVCAFAAYESCGTCTPCRLGAARLAAWLGGTGEGDSAQVTRDEVDGLVDALATASLCGLGTGLADFLRSLQRHYPDEWTSCCMSRSMVAR